MGLQPRLRLGVLDLEGVVVHLQGAGAALWVSPLLKLRCGGIIQQLCVALFQLAQCPHLLQRAAHVLLGRERVLQLGEVRLRRCGEWSLSFT